MKTNFFETLQSLQLKSDWNISIKAESSGGWIVSVLLIQEDIGDDASKTIPPMLFKGSPQELDNGFFEALKQPAKEVDGLFCNMKQFVLELEKAKEKSKMEEESTKKQKIEKEEKKKKFDMQMKKVTELEEKEKWGEAIGAMPRPENFPDQADDIKIKMDELRKKHGSLELFS